MLPVPSTMTKSIFTATLLIAACRFAQSAEIIFSDRREEDSFKRISEHLTGEENPGRYAIARTDPSQRNGYYIALKLDSAGESDKVSAIRLQFVRPGSQDRETRTLSVEPNGKRRILVGMTDGIWGASPAIPTAWKIDLLDDAGAILSSAKSFLWSSDS